MVSLRAALVSFWAVAVIWLLVRGIYNSAEETEFSSQVPKQSISFLLDAENLKLLRKGKDYKTKWNPRWQKFQSEYKRSVPIASSGFKGWDDIKDNIDSLDEFVKLCENDGRKKVINDKDPLYKAVKDFCSEQKSNN